MPALLRSMICFSSLTLLCQCDDGRTATATRRLQEDVSRLEDRNRRADADQKRVDEQLEQLRASKADMEEQKNAAEARLAAAEAALKKVKQEFDDYKATHKLDGPR